MTHRIKIQDVFADAVMSGQKTFEVRRNDRNYQRGDHVVFTAVVNGKKINHPINKEQYEITYVLSGWGLKDGYVAFGIKREPTLEELLDRVK